MDKVQCKICGEYFNKITAKHLRLHGITTDKYRQRFPDADLVADKTRERMAKSAKRFGKQFGFRLAESIENEVREEYKSEASEWRKKYGVRLSFNEFLNNLLELGLRVKRGK